MMKTLQHSLFDGNLADSMSRDAVMEKGLKVQLDPFHWVSFGYRGVHLHNKTMWGERIVTDEVLVSPLAMLPMAAYSLKNTYYAQMLYTTVRGTLGMDTMALTVLLNRDGHTKALRYLASKGFTLTEGQWDDLADTLRAVIRVMNTESSEPGQSLPVRIMSPMEWTVDDKDFMVPRQKRLSVIMGGNGLIHTTRALGHLRAV